MKTIYTFSFAVLILVVSSSSARISFNYDFSKINYTRSTVQRLENQSWVDETRTTCYYDEQKRLIELNEENISGVSWAKYSRSILIYSGSSLDSIISKSWDPGAENDKVTMVSKCTYNSSGFLSSVSAEFDIDGNTLSSHAIITYDNQGRIIADTIYEIDSYGSTRYYNVNFYAPHYRTRICFDAIGDYWSKDSTILSNTGDDSISYGFSNDGSVWKTTSKTEWIYTGDKVVMELHSDWNGSAFVLSRRTLFKYENSASATTFVVPFHPIQETTGMLITIGRKSTLPQKKSERLNLLGRKISTQRTISQGVLMYKYRE